MPLPVSVTSSNPGRDTRDFEGSNTSQNVPGGKPHKKAKHAYVSNRPGGPAQSASLKGLKQAAQGPMAPGNSVMGPAGG